MTDWGKYTLTIKDRSGNIVAEISYTGMSGSAMMDEAYAWRVVYPADEGYSVDW